MNQAEINFNELPRPGLMFRYGTQNYKLYSAFCEGPVTALQMSRLLGPTASHTSRMCDIDKRMEVVCPGEFKRIKTKISHNVFEYSYIRIANRQQQAA